MGKKIKTTRKSTGNVIAVAPKTDAVEGKHEEERTATYFFIFVLVNNPISGQHVFRVLEEVEKIKSPKEQTVLHMVLNSTGGDIYAAYKIVNILREYAGKIRTVVPLYAKSAATLIAIGADDIIMGAQSELGPLDLPIEHPLMEGIRISALDGIRPIDVLANLASEIAIGEVGVRLRQEVRMGRKDAVELALKFASDYISPIVSKLDPAVVNRCYRELRIAQTYGQQLLETYMLAKHPDKEKKAESIAESLVWDYPAHEFAICFREAKKLGLNVSAWREYEYRQPVWDAFMSARKNPTGVFQLFSEKEFLSTTNAQKGRSE